METAEKTELIIPDKEIVTQKRASWANLGELIYSQELGLQAKAQASLAKIKLPTSIKDVAEAEKTLKEVKADAALIEAERKTITSKFDGVSKRLMEPEKSFAEPLKQLTDTIISIKKSDEERQRNQRLKLEALKNSREFLTTTRNNADAGFKNKIIEKVNNAYSHALGKGEVTLEMVPEFIDFVLSRTTASDFVLEAPLNASALVTPEEYKALCTELLTIDAKPYLADYENQLRAKFSDYAVAINNKQQALLNAQNEEKAKKEAIASQQTNANVAAKLEAIASEDPVVSLGGKDLKKSFEVDMPETVESVIVIMTAFTAHLNLCLPELKVNKWFSFTPAQICTALSKVKTKDNGFNPAGITFKSVEKL